jgi:hypothetical protein
MARRLRSNPNVALDVYLGRLARLALQDRLDQSASTIAWQHRLRASRSGRLKIAEAQMRLDRFLRGVARPRPDAAP